MASPGLPRALWFAPGSGTRLWCFARMLWAFSARVRLRGEPETSVGRARNQWVPLQPPPSSQGPRVPSPSFGGPCARPPSAMVTEGRRTARSYTHRSAGPLGAAPSSQSARSSGCGHCGDLGLCCHMLRLAGDCLPGCRADGQLCLTDVHAGPLCSPPGWPLGPMGRGEASPRASSDGICVAGSQRPAVVTAAPPLQKVRGTKAPF